MNLSPLSSADRARRAELLSPQDLAALGGIEFIARRVVEGFITGLHRSPHRGFSVEFAEHRMYQPGDDLRYIDWRMSSSASSTSTCIAALAAAASPSTIASSTAR